uniref:Uncharacterized protein n=1 Tax=Nelumbo nucifera TaxID=4432 RepID=A0A822YFL5_NELNU|nr:TPA_asm: hypothetical protein HUJ06_009814 [Nelumbo nucifera]
MLLTYKLLMMENKDEKGFFPPFLSLNTSCLMENLFIKKKSLMEILVALISIS